MFKNFKTLFEGMDAGGAAEPAARTPGKFKRGKQRVKRGGGREWWPDSAGMGPWLFVGYIRDDILPNYMGIIS